jgi:hypothetical protein
MSAMVVPSCAVASAPATQIVLPGEKWHRKSDVDLGLPEELLICLWPISIQDIDDAVGDAETAQLESTVYTGRLLQALLERFGENATLALEPIPAADIYVRVSCKSLLPEGATTISVQLPSGDPLWEAWGQNFDPSALGDAIVHVLKHMPLDADSLAVQRARAYALPLQAGLPADIRPSDAAIRAAKLGAALQRRRILPAFTAEWLANQPLRESALQAWLDAVRAARFSTGYVATPTFHGLVEALAPKRPASSSEILGSLLQLENVTRRDIGLRVLEVWE